MRLGYGRVSTRDQHPEAQHDALTEAGCDRLFIEKRSGKLASRPELNRLLEHMREGDTVVVTKLDRLGRSLGNLIELEATFRAAGVGLVILNLGVDTSTPSGRMVFNMVGAVAEFEASLNSERTLDGLAAARARGRTGGQKPKLKARQIRLAQEMYDELGSDGKRRYTVQQIADEFGVSRPTIYRHLEKARD